MLLAERERAAVKRCVLCELALVVGTPRTEEGGSLSWGLVRAQKLFERAKHLWKTLRSVDLFLTDRGELTTENAQLRVKYRADKALKLRAHSQRPLFEQLSAIDQDRSDLDGLHLPSREPPPLITGRLEIDHEVIPERERLFLVQPAHARSFSHCRPMRRGDSKKT